jgi:hypothetical protein
MRNMAQPEQPQRDSVFFVAVAIDEENYWGDCRRALAVLRQAGYFSRPMTHEMLDLAAKDRKGASPQWRETGIVETAPRDEPPTAA